MTARYETGIEWISKLLEATSPKLQSVIADHCETEKKVTVTLFPDPFWRAKSKGVLDSITDICEGE